MPTYKAPIDDTLFVLYDVLGMEKYGNLPGFSDASRDVVEAILGEGAKLCEEVLQPLNAVGDHHGCVRHADGSVTTPPGFKEAYKQYCDGGWMSLAFDPEYGGQGLPYVLNTVIGEYLSSSNLAWGMYPGLTQGAMAALYVHGSDEIKRTYLPKMTTGEWTGTMNLTEPHCGTDLGMLRTKAVPQGDGSYKITGQKIFISAGEHDMSQNIVHLVLARIEGAPAGTKGISLFVVPKFIPDAQNNPGAKNPVSCGKIEEKMGIHGNSTCVMNYDGAIGWLVGKENQGLPAMFVMMNEARLSVGLQGLAVSEVAYQNAVAYAKDRIQGRSLSGPKSPEKAADAIIVHPDVRRNLMTMRAINEAGRALVLWTALQSDVNHRSQDAAEKQKADDLLGLMTPVIKGVLTDLGFDNAVKAQQMYGGHGYINEWGMGQFVRDARITMIYEGANGIQALDLVGRKLGLNGGRAVMAFFNEVGSFCAAHKDDATIGPFIAGLSRGLGQLQEASMWLMQNAMQKPDNAGAGSTPYMHLFGLVAMGYMWARMAKAANDNLAAGANGSTDRMNAKLTTARFYFEQLMPETTTLKHRVTAGADSMMALPADMF